jgi:hypothetical protein
MFDMPGLLPSGDTYEPQVMIADGLSMGTAKSPDGRRVSLVSIDARHTAAAVTVLQADLPAESVDYDAYAVTATDVYVMRSTANANGIATESLWRVPRAGGRPVEVLADAGQALFQGSANDLQAADGTLRWIATDPHDPSRTDLDTMPLPGGPLTSRRLDGQYTLSTYPMLYSGQQDDPPTPQLTDSLTGTVTTVHTAAPAATLCDPGWCVMQTSDEAGANTVTLSRPDGSRLQHLGDTGTSLITADATLAGRFVGLTEQTAAQAATLTPATQLWLYDIDRRRSVEITTAATASAGAGSWLWWSTGDNETLTWHALDLTTLR